MLLNRGATKSERIGGPRTDKLIDASIQWAERIMQKIDEVR